MHNEAWLSLELELDNRSAINSKGVFDEDDCVADVVVEFL